MKLGKIPVLFTLVLGAAGLPVLQGCGGGSGANVITVSVSASGSTNVIVGTNVNLTATVSGATTLTATWQPCMYTTTTTDSTGKSTTSGKLACPPDSNHTPSDPNFTIFGSFTNQQTTTAPATETFTAASTLPDQKTYPGLQIIVTAQSTQDTKKTGSITLTLNSGISLVLTPSTATVPTKESQLFTVSLTNDTQTGGGVTWLITQQVPTSTTPPSQLTTCSPTCGTITPDTKIPNAATYKAPDTIPTSITPPDKTNTNSPASLTVVATSNADNSRVATGSITIIQGGPITFNGIFPTIAPQGAAFWDIYLDAPNISSSSVISLTPSPTNQVPSGQIKVLFPIPTSSTANPTSTGARIRLFASDLMAAGSVTVSVTDLVEPVTTCNTTPPPTGCSTTGAFTFNVMPVRATTTATNPDDFVLSSQGPFPVTIDGGYFGPKGNSAFAFFQSLSGTALSAGTGSSARQIFTSVNANDINPKEPGLYPLYVRTNTSPAPSQINPAVSNIALFPDYSTGQPQPQVVGSIPAGMNPSAVDIDPTLGVLAVAETGSNTIEFFSISQTAPFLTSLGVVGNTAATPINVPTGISIDRNNHTVAVVNYGSQMMTNGVCTVTGQSVTVLPIPGAPPPPPGNPAPTTFSVDLTAPYQTGPMQSSPVCPAPMPYSIAVDSDSHLALVAYSSTSITSTANVGFVVNLNPNSASNSNPYGCIVTDAISGLTTQNGPVGQCLFAQVTLNTGVYPRVTMSPHNHLALVTPGGTGAVRGVDVTQISSANFILNSVLSAGLATVTVDTTKCPPPRVPVNSTSSTNACPLLMVPGNAGTVLISGVTPGTAANASFFNGEFFVNVTSNNTFTYTVPNLTVTDGGTGGTVFYGNPGLTFRISSSIQGVAINPVTNTAALADANSTGTNGPQIDLLNGLDQSVSSITFFADCTAFFPPNTSCPSSPELLATTDVAWQPFANELISYNPKLGQLSVSDPVSRKRYARIPQAGSSQPPLGPSAISISVSNASTGNLTLWGGVVVDPATNQAFVVESGQAGNSSAMPPILALPGQIEIVNLASTIKQVHISELLVPNPTPGVGVIGGIPGASVPNATLTSATDLAGVQIFGSGFAQGGTPLVRLDGMSINGFCSAPNPPSCVTVNSDRELVVTIPASIPTANPNNPFKPLSAPHHFALDVVSNNVQSNVTDFYVIQSVNLLNPAVCKDAQGNPIQPQPTGVAIADQLRNGPFSPIAVVTNTGSGCGSISIIDISPGSSTFGTVLNTISVGNGPLGVAISQRFGLAVVANNGDSTASIVDLLAGKQAVPAVSTGKQPMGVAVNDSSAVAITANNGANTVTEINLAPLFASTPATTLTPTSIGGMQQPIAVAIDPDRGTNNRGIAVVTGLQLQNGASPTGALYVVDMGGTTPTLISSNSFFSAIPTGVVFDPAAATTSANPGVFYANASGTNLITAFNPDSGGTSASVSVGINPTSLAINPQTGAILTTNTAGQSISLVDTVSSPLKTRNTLALPNSPQFGVAIDQFTNLAVIVDQANNRVLLFPMPN
jgi:DNA-binding beta-propeller fold protein YncE